MISFPVVINSKMTILSFFVKRIVITVFRLAYLIPFVILLSINLSSSIGLIKQNNERSMEASIDFPLTIAKGLKNFILF